MDDIEKDEKAFLNEKTQVTIVPSQPSQVAVAIEIQNGKLVFKDGKRDIRALYEASLRVPEGNICALLGPSGCGKTTLIRCLIGLVPLQEGQARLFGYTPGSRESGVPGSGVGYMPQNLSLYAELEVGETLRYFGRLQQMTEKAIRKRSAFLVRLLSLPIRKRLRVSQMSGGQQRRLSLAAALIADPPLLFLDEPATGLDPLLRKTLWTHLEHLAHEQGKTILVSTHYIEEARKANMVAFMREGTILTTGNPEELIQRLQCRNLDDVFLRICESKGDPDIFDPLAETTREDTTHHHLDQGGTIEQFKYRTLSNGSLVIDSQEYVDSELFKTSSKNGNTLPSRTRTNVEQCLSPSSHKTGETLDRLEIKKKRYEDKEVISYGNFRVQPFVPKNSYHTFLNIVRTITWKNSCLLRRNIILLIFMIACPLMNVLMAKLILGRPPFDLPLAVVNDERPTNKSAIFLHHLEATGTFSIRQVSDIAEGISLVRGGHAWAALHLPANISISMLKIRSLDDFLMGSSTDENSKLYVDSTSIEIFRTLYFTIVDTYATFREEVFVSLEMNPLLARNPLVMEEPVFGSKTPHFADFTNANLLSDSLFIMGLGLAALSLIMEKVNGLLERGRVTGMTVCHLLVSHAIVNSAVAICQTCVLLVYITIVFPGSRALSPFILIVLFCFIASTVGMSIGLLISALARRPFPALLLVTGLYQSNGLASGMLWPYESQPKWIRYLTALSPQTFTVQAIREVLFKGWGIEHKIVWSAIQVGVAWTICPLLLVALMFSKSCRVSEIFTRLRRRNANPTDPAEMKELLT